MRPRWRLTLVESTVKKAAFLEHVVEAMDLGGVAVLAERVEKVGQDPDHRERYDVGVTRAVATFRQTGLGAV